MYTDVLTWYWYYNNQTLVGFVQYMLNNVNTCQEEKFASPPFTCPHLLGLHILAGHYDSQAEEKEGNDHSVLARWEVWPEQEQTPRERALLYRLRSATNRTSDQFSQLVSQSRFIFVLLVISNEANGWKNIHTYTTAPPVTGNHSLLFQPSR